MARAEQALAAVGAAVRATHDGRVVGGHARYAGVLDLDGHRVALSADSVGTKVLLHEAMGTWAWCAQDCVAMVVNDLAASGARPTAFLDYYATGALDPERFSAVVEGVAAACKACGVILLGGETAEMPGVYGPGKIDLVGFGMGVFGGAANLLLPAETLAQGDVLIGVSSSGFHSNGLSLVRAMVEDLGLDLQRPRPGGETPLGRLLAEPTRLYAEPVRLLQEAAGEGLKGVAHITGGGLVRNLGRILPDNLDARVDPSAFPRPSVLDWLVARGGLDLDEAYATFNMGLGLVAAVRPEEAAPALAALASLPYPSWKVGEVVPGHGAAAIG